MKLKLKKTSLAFVILGGMGVLAAVPQVASAANININDAVDGNVTFTVSDFEYGFNVNNTVVQTSTGSAGQVTSGTFAENGSAMNFTGTWITLGTALPSSSQVLFVEPNDPTMVSDVLNLSYVDNGNGTGTINGSFLSGSGLGMVSDYANATGTYVEGSTKGGYQFSANYLTGQAVSAVPLPASSILFGTGLIGLVGVSRRKRSAA